MVLLKKSVVAANTGSPSASRKRAAPDAPNQVSRQKKSAASQGMPLVSVTTAGGYTVFGSPIRPAHLTTEQIARAIADLD